MKNRIFPNLLVLLALVIFHSPIQGQSSDSYLDFYENTVINKFKDSPEFNRNYEVQKVFENGTIVFSESNTILEKDLMGSIGLDKTSSFDMVYEAASMLDNNTKTKRFEQYYKGIKVHGGGYALFMNTSLKTDRVLSFTPYIFYDIDVDITPKVDDNDIIALLKPDDNHYTKELIINHHYRKAYSLCYYVEYSFGGHPYNAWVDAQTGELFEKVEAHVHLDGNTPTYGLQSLIDLTISGTTSLESPSQDIRIYEGLNPSYPLNVSQWQNTLIPTTTNTVAWGTDATPHSQQTLHSATEVIPIYASQAGINYGNVHIAANSVANAYAVGGAVTPDAYITAGIYGTAPLSLHDVVGHELGHIYIWTFLQYVGLGNRSLHEGFSDVFGTYVESFVQTGGVDWVVGDDETAVANWLNRDMSNPVCLNTIGGSAHTRGLIAGHWFHTISVGNSSINVNALGMPTAIALIKDAFALIPATSDYAEFRDASLTVAQNNWGFCSPEYRSIVNAWNHVCVTTPTCPVCPSGPDWIVNSNTTINSDMMIGGNIIVQPGVQLTVNAKLEFLQGKALVVRQGAKLDLNNGHLTRCPNAPDWRGIVVEGFSNQSQPNAFSGPAVGQAGIVLIRNNSLIEWARTAISTNYWGGWTSSKWGGLVHVENSEFYNNNRVAEFMKYSFTNKSKFVNVTMDGNSTITGNTVGVTIWDTDGITFNKCRFYNMESQGVLTYDAGARIVDANDFMHNNKGVSNRATYPFGSYLIVGQDGTDPNYFYDNWFHVESYASDKLSGLLIRNNEFFDANSAMWIVGPSRYRVERNSLANSTGGVVSLHAGSMNANQHNYVRYNGFNTSSGVTAYGRNRELQILCNEYVNNWDIRVTQTNSGSDPGEIRLFQGTLFSPTGNCLTNPPMWGDITTVGSTVAFNYYHQSNPACHVPVNPGNYTALQSNYEGCKQIGPVKPPKYDYWLAVLEKIKILEEKDDVYNDDYYSLLEERDDMMVYFVDKALSDNNSELALSFLDEANTTYAVMAKFGIHMNNDNFDKAKELLEYFKAGEHPEFEDFVNIQEINIARLSDLEGFKLTDGDQEYLAKIAESDYGVKAYARSLLGILTGKEYTDKYEIEGGGEGDGKLKSIEVREGQNANLTVSPNPAMNEIIVNLTSINEIENLSLEIVDINGQLKFSNNIGVNRSLEIDISTYAKGIYFLRILNEEKQILYLEKVIKL